MFSFIFSYNRPDHLYRCAGELEQFSRVYVIDDCSNFIVKGYSHYRSKMNRGKKGYYLQWQEAFNRAKRFKDDVYIFSPDDAIDFDYLRIKQMVEGLSGAWCINFFKDHRDECWVNFKPIPININGIEARQIGFMDCAIVISREALELLDFKIPPIPKGWLNAGYSSGVGKYLSQEMKKLNIPIYQPLTSLAHHNGNDCSVMHKEERKKIPIFTQ